MVIFSSFNFYLNSLVCVYYPTLGNRTRVNYISVCMSFFCFLLFLQDQQMLQSMQHLDQVCSYNCMAHLWVTLGLLIQLAQLLIVLLCFVLTFLSNKTFSYSKNTYLYLKSTTQICGVHHLISIFPGLNIIQFFVRKFGLLNIFTLTNLLNSCSL